MAPYPFRVTLHAVILVFSCQKNPEGVAAARWRQVVRLAKRRESWLGSSKHEKGTALHYTQANLAHNLRSADLIRTTK